VPGLTVGCYAPERSYALPYRPRSFLFPTSSMFASNVFHSWTKPLCSTESMIFPQWLKLSNLKVFSKQHVTTRSIKNRDYAATLATVVKKWL
jgi:hypothetical protein